MNRQKIAMKKINLTKWRLLWILIAAAWFFVFLNLIVGAVFEKNTSLVAAFSGTNPQEISATVEVTARYLEPLAGEMEKYWLMQEVADSIGLTLDATPEVTKTEARQEMRFFKDAWAADTELKVISLVTGEDLPGDMGVSAGESEMEHYFYAKICLKESLDTVLAYKALLEETLEKLACGEISTTIQLVGDYGGYLTLERRNEITEDILKALGAEVVYEYREHELYTVYAYTASLDNYITVENRKINVHIAMSQDEEHYRTILYLASPILPDTW